MIRALRLWTLRRFWGHWYPKLAQECPYTFIPERAGDSLTVCLDTTEEWDP